MIATAAKTDFVTSNSKIKHNQNYKSFYADMFDKDFCHGSRNMHIYNYREFQKILLDNEHYLNVHSANVVEKYKNIYDKSIISLFSQILFDWKHYQTLTISRWYKVTKMTIKSIL